MNKKKLIIIIVVVLLVVVIGVVAAMFLLGGDKDKEEPEPELLEFELGEKMGNLSPDPDKSNAKAPIIKYNAVVVYTGEKTAEVLTKKKTLIGNEFNKYFIKKTIAHVRRQDKVQEDLTEIVKEIMGENADVIKDVLFKDITWQ